MQRPIAIINDIFPKDLHKVQTFNSIEQFWFHKAHRIITYVVLFEAPFSFPDIWYGQELYGFGVWWGWAPKIASIRAWILSSLDGPWDVPDAPPDTVDAPGAADGGWVGICCCTVEAWCPINAGCCWMFSCGPTVVTVDGAVVETGTCWFDLHEGSGKATTVAMSPGVVSFGVIWGDGGCGMFPTATEPWPVVAWMLAAELAIGAVIDYVVAVVLAWWATVQITEPESVAVVFAAGTLWLVLWMIGCSSCGIGAGWNGVTPKYCSALIGAVVTSTAKPPTAPAPVVAAPAAAVVAGTVGFSALAVVVTTDRSLTAALFKAKWLLYIC